MSIRVPALYALALAVLMGASWLKTGAVSPPSPQTTANLAWRELWIDHADGPHGAIDLFRQALAEDTAFPYRWSDLGEPLAATGQTDSARYCFRHAVELSPNSPQIAIRAANFYLSEGDSVPALQLLTTILRLTSDYDAMVFNSLVRLVPLDRADPGATLQTAIGSNTRAREGFFRFLIGLNDEPLLSATWNWMEVRSYVTRPLAVLWAEWLGTHRDGERAFSVWKRHAALDPAYGITGWIDNSGFENEPAGQGFDWRIQPSPGVKATLDSAVAHSGKSSLRLDFDGSVNDDFRPATQRVWLPPGRYRLTTWVRTANLSTDQGVMLILNRASTPALTGDHDWTRLSADISVPGKALLEELQIVRQRSLKFDGKLRGTAWIDDVELTRVE